MATRIDFLAEDTLIVRFNSPTSPALSARIKHLVGALRQRFGASILEFVPSYASVFIQFDLFSLTHDDLQRQIKELLAQASAQASAQVANAPAQVAAKVVQIPVCYAREFALDITAMAEQHQCSPAEIARLHCATVYTVFAIGFCPGFAFLGEVPNAIATPRKATPRALVPAGSVGIAGRQTGVYPLDSPGGWNIIGNSPMPLLDFNLPSLCPMQIGDQVKFSAITAEEYHFLKGSDA